MRDMIAKKRMLSHIGFTVAILVPIALTFYFIIAYGSNVPRWDEWLIVRYYREMIENGFALERLLTFQDNEHRIIIPVLVQTLIWALTNGNDHVVLIVSQCCLLAAFFLIVLYWKKEKRPIFGLLPIPVLIFSMKQGMLTFWPSCIMWSLLVLFSVSSFFCFYQWTHTQKKQFSFLSILFAVATTFCAASGLLIWIAYVALFLAQRIFEQKKTFTQTHFMFLLMGVLCFWFYLTNWNRTTSEYSAKSPMEFLKAVVENIACIAFEEQHKWAAIILGTLLLIIFILCGCHICVHKQVSQMLFPLLIAGFFFGAIIAIAYARGGMGAFNGMGTEVVLASQYSMMPTWFLVGVFLLFYEILCGVYPIGKNQWHIIYLPCILYIVLLTVSAYKIPIAKTYSTLHQACAYIVQNYDQIPETIRVKYVYPADVSSDVNWIKENRLFLFNSSKVYLYPYNDIPATPMEAHETLELPGLKVPPGIYWLDKINNIPISNQISIQATEGVSLDFWALDSEHVSAASSVWLKFAGNYYQLTSVASPSVAEYYHEDAYENCGYRGFILTDKIFPGTYELNLIVILATGDAYYEVPITNITVEADCQKAA